MSKTEKKVTTKIAKATLPDEEYNKTWNREKKFKL